MILTRRAALAGLASTLASPALSAPREVDVKLVLAIDTSPSVDEKRWAIQQEGYAAAFANPKIQDAMLGGYVGSVAVCVVQWSGRRAQYIAVRWIVVDSPEQANLLSMRLHAMERFNTTGTAIGAALQFTSKLIHDAPFTAQRSVIDISGDGPDNVDLGVSFVRNDVLKKDKTLTINGLVLLGYSAWEAVHLPAYYENHVIGGPKAFKIVVEDSGRLDLFREGLELKLLKELTS